MANTLKFIAITIAFITIIASVAALGLLMTQNSEPTQTGLTKVASFEGATLYRTAGDGGNGRFYVISLNGTFTDMGRQYGYLLKPQINAVYNLMCKQAQPGLDKQNVTMAEMADYYYSMQTQYAKEFVAGMAQTSGLSLRAQIDLSVMPTLIYSAVGCSSMDAWGSYSTDGSMVVGRNWDLGNTLFDNYAKYLVVTVYNPSGYASSVAEVGYIGSAWMQTAMNNHGIFIDLQNGAGSDPTFNINYTCGATEMFTFLLNSTTLQNIDAFFQSTRSSTGLLMNVADANQAYVYEWATFGVKSRTGDGLVASSNHFVESSWTNLPAVADGAVGAFTKDRLANLLYLGERFKGTIDAEKMMQIFDRPILNGGPTFPPDGYLKTYYQTVAVPGELIWWLKAPGYSGWEQVDLNPLFQTAP